EATLIPMALMIGMYGHERRVYAAVKFFLYTMVASVFMLAAIIWLYVNVHDASGQGTFDFVTIKNAIQSGQIANFARAAQFLFLGVFIGQPPGILRAGDLYLHCCGNRWRGLSDAESWRFYWRAVHAARHALRPPAYVCNF